MKRNVSLIPHLCLYSQKDFQQDVGHSSDLGQKQSGIPQTKKDQEENGIRVAELMMIKIGRKRTPSFPCNESVLSRNAQKQRSWKIIFFTSVPMVIRLKLFFAQSFLSISSVSKEQSAEMCEEVQYLSNKHRETCCGRAIRPIFRASRLIDNDTQTFH